MAQIKVKILNKADSHDITEILLKVALNITTPSPILTSFAKTKLSLSYINISKSVISKEQAHVVGRGNVIIVTSLTSTTHWTHCYHSCHTKLSVISAVLKTSGLELVLIVKGFGLYWKHLDLNWCSLWKVLDFTESIWTWNGVHCGRFWIVLKPSGLWIGVQLHCERCWAVLNVVYQYIFLLI